MNMHTPEQLRQHNEHIARRERLAKPARLMIASSPDMSDVQILSSKCAKLAEKVKSLEAKLKDTADQLTDAQATVLRQAEALSDIDEMNATAQRPVRVIVNEVLEAFPGITWLDIKGPRRTDDIVVPRSICMAAVKDERPNLSYPFIGRQFGERDHTSVLYHVRKIKALMTLMGNMPWERFVEVVNAAIKGEKA